MIKYTLVIVLNFLLVIQSISSMENVLIQMEENLLYTQLHTRPNLSLFYQILLKSNGIDDPTRMERKITPEDIQQLHLENKVRERFCLTHRLSFFFIRSVFNHWMIYSMYLIFEIIVQMRISLVKIFVDYLRH